MALGGGGYLGPLNSAQGSAKIQEGQVKAQGKESKDKDVAQAFIRLQGYPPGNEKTYPTMGYPENHRLKYTLGGDMLVPRRLKKNHHVKPRRDRISCNGWVLCAYVLANRPNHPP